MKKKYAFEIDYVDAYNIGKEQGYNMAMKEMDVDRKYFDKPIKGDKNETTRCK